MDEQEKGLQEEMTEDKEQTEVQDEQLESQEEQPTPQDEQTEADEEHVDKLKETTEKIWGSTRSAWNTATFKASQYKKLVQKKIDISALHKKINGAHAELGKLIDDLRTEGKKNIMSLDEVKEVLDRIDELKVEAATLEEDVEKLKSEDPPAEEIAEQEEEKDQTS